MTTVLAFLMIGICLAVHELGHAFAMQKHGVKISEICLFGIAGPKILIAKSEKIFGGAEITVRPFFPLGAFVRPDKDISSCDKKAQVDINSAGISANIQFGLLMFAICFCVLQKYTALLLTLYMSVVFYLVVNRFKAVTIITLGIITAAYTIKVFIYEPVSIGSIVTIVSLVKNTSPNALLIYTGAISISLGIFNTAPFFGLDGYRVLDLYLPQKTRLAVSVVAIVSIFAVSVLAVWNDILLLFQ